MQYNQITNFSWSIETGANNLQNNRYRAVRLVSVGGTGIASTVNAATQKPVGIQEDTPPTSWGYVSVESNGIAMVECGAAVTAGSEVSIMSTGQIEDINGANTVIGVALTNGVSGDIISIKLKNM